MTPELRQELELLQRKAKETNGELSIEECHRVVQIAREGRISMPEKKKAEEKEKRQLNKGGEKSQQAPINFDDI